MFSEFYFHLVGIGGIGMSGVARILAMHGKTISGSDREASPVTKKLQEEGFGLKIGEAAENLPAETEVVIHTTAAKPDENLELLEAKKRGIKIFTYPEALGEITKDKRLVAITGAHGKSTTTGLLIAAALAAGEDISCLVGTNLSELAGGNARVGKSNWFILEACEYRRAFLSLQPEILVVTNIEAEHLDYYRDLADYQSAFVELAQKLPKGGALIADSQEPNLEPVIEAASKFIDSHPPAPSQGKGELRLQIPGLHNQQNAALALRTAEVMGFDSKKVRQGIESYAGAWRRFELRGELHGAPVIDDYGHHPTEIRATLQAARERYPDRRIVICYQQHQLDRATKMLPELGKSFAGADLVLIPNIYKVRDDPKDAKISGADIVAEIQQSGVEAIYTKNFENTVNWLQANITAKDMVLVMGAGDIFRMTEKLLK